MGAKRCYPFQVTLIDYHFGVVTCLFVSHRFPLRLVASGKCRVAYFAGKKAKLLFSSQVQLLNECLNCTESCIHLST